MMTDNGVSLAARGLTRVYRRGSEEISALDGVSLTIRRGGGFEAIYPVLTAVCQFFDDLAGLQEKGHIDADSVWQSWGRTVQFWWAALEPSIIEGRVVENSPKGNARFERLNELMYVMDAKDGRFSQAAVVFGSLNR